MISFRIIVSVLFAFVLAALAACGGSGGGAGNAPSDPKGLVLEDAYSVEITNVRALLESSAVPAFFLDEDEDPEDFKDDWRDAWEDRSRALATDPDTVTQDLQVSAGVGGYYITRGEFEFAAIKNELEDQGYDDGNYRDREIWESENGNAVALFEGSGSFVSGSTDTVKEVLKAIARGEGFMTDEADLRRAWDKVDGGALSINVETECSGLSSSLNGCRAYAGAITGGDEDYMEVMGAAVFSSERRAESGMDDIEDEIEDDDSLDADLEEIRVDGEAVIFKLTVYR